MASMTPRQKPREAQPPNRMSRMHLLLSFPRLESALSVERLGQKFRGRILEFHPLNLPTMQAKVQQIRI